MKRIASLLLIFVLFAAITVPAGAADDSNKPQYVIDNANVLTSALEQTITDANTDLIGNCSGATITVVTVAHSPDGMNHEQYAKQLFNDMGLGNAGQNIGMLLVLYTEDDSFWLEKGAGLNSLSTVGEISALLDDNSDFNKYLRQDMDAEGVSWLLDKLVIWYYDNFHTSFLSSGYTSSNSAQSQPGYTPPKRSGLGFGKLVLILIVLVLLISPLWIKRKYNRWGVWPFVIFSRWWATRPRTGKRPLFRRATPTRAARSAPGNPGRPGMGAAQSTNRPTAGYNSYNNGPTSRSTAGRSIGSFSTGRSNKRPSGFGRQK